MTEYEFIMLVKEMRQQQVEYRKNMNMKIIHSMQRLEKQVDTNIRLYEEQRETCKPKQITMIKNLFPNDEPQKHIKYVLGSGNNELGELTNLETTKYKK